MKRMILVSFIVVILLHSVVFALPKIIVNKIDPQPVEPGKDLTIDVTIFNEESSGTGDFTVEMEHQFPFIFKSSTEDLSKINLCATCQKQNRYFLTVDANAVSGTYPVFVKEYTSNLETKKQVDIKIQGKPSIIFSTSVQGLDKIIPNSEFAVVIDVNNIGSGQARQIKIQPESSMFVVIGGSVKSLDNLNPRETKQVVFDFVSASDIDASSYSIPFKISYLDEQGASINASQNLGVKVVNKGEISIQTIKIASTSTGSVSIAASEPFTIIARLENVGEGNADSIVTDIICPFEGSKRAFMGQLKKDEDAPAVFNLITSKSGEFKCKILVSYEDDLGSHQKEEEFGVSIASPDYSGVVVFIIIILVLVFIFRKRISFFKKKK